MKANARLPQRALLVAVQIRANRLYWAPVVVAETPALDIGQAEEHLFAEVCGREKRVMQDTQLPGLLLLSPSRP